jgi:nicotinic acid mononucleotide adenylyltransferase
LWQDYQKLVGRGRFFVGLRSEDDGEIVMRLKMDELKEAVVKMTQSTKPLISSSKVRRDLIEGHVSTEVEPKVMEYIEKYGIYR